jgi:hypothetical protein
MRPAVVEYIDLPTELSEAVDDSGRLVYNAASICIHYYSVPFLLTTCAPDKLPKAYHLAHKKIPVVNDEGETITPEAPNGIKLETFIFDVFPLAQNLVGFEADRAAEFAPVKNATGSDSPATAQQLLSSLHRSWLEAAGAHVEGEGLVEVSPLVSYAGEGLNVVAGHTFHTPCAVLPSVGECPLGVRECKPGVYEVHAPDSDMEWVLVRTPKTSDTGSEGSDSTSPPLMEGVEDVSGEEGGHAGCPVRSAISSLVLWKRPLRSGMCVYVSE